MYNNTFFFTEDRFFRDEVQLIRTEFSTHPEHSFPGTSEEELMKMMGLTRTVILKNLKLDIQTKQHC